MSTDYRLLKGICDAEQYESEALALYDKDESVMPKEMIIIPKGKYDWLNWRSAILNFLEERGVRNWSGFAYPPDREDYETDEAYWEAYSEACDNY